MQSRPCFQPWQHSCTGELPRAVALPMPFSATLRFCHIEKIACGEVIDIDVLEDYQREGLQRGQAGVHFEFTAGTSLAHVQTRCASLIKYCMC